jgi:hypothetical protein
MSTHNWPTRSVYLWESYSDSAHCWLPAFHVVPVQKCLEPPHQIVLAFSMGMDVPLEIVLDPHHWGLRKGAVASSSRVIDAIFIFPVFIFKTHVQVLFAGQ